MWHGSPAALAQIGIEPGRAVERGELVAALQGKHVESGAQVRRPGSRVAERDGEAEAERVVKSVDLTFSVPKSISVVWSQAGPSERARIEADVLDVAGRTLDFMATQKSCVHRRDADGERYRERAVGVAAAVSLHVTARQAAGDRAPAPQLHVHGVVVGVLRRDGELVTPDPWAWFRDGAAREGARSGARCSRSDLPPVAMRSKRTRARPAATSSWCASRRHCAPRCRAAAARSRPAWLRWNSRRDARCVAARSPSWPRRRGRRRKLDHAEVASWWDAVAGKHGFGRAEAETLRDLRRAHQRNERAVAEAIMRGITADGPTVTTVEARCIALEAAPGRTSARRAIEILGELQQVGVVIALSDDRSTTRSIRELERAVLRTARRNADVARPIPTASLREGIRAAEAGLGSQLDPEQRAAVEAICFGSCWSNLVGRAGVGKGPALEAVAHAHGDAGWQVLACAVDGTTARRLAHQVHGRGYTIDGLMHRMETGRLAATPTTLVVIDEASKVDTARWAQLAQLIDGGCGRILAVGDHGQLQAIELPGLFTEICRHAPTVELTEIRRHRNPTDPAREHPWLARYQTALHDGRGQEAVAILQEHDVLKLHDTRAEAMVALVDDWTTWRNNYPVDQSMLLVHGTNDDVDTVNELAQIRRLEAGELGTAHVRAPDRDYHLHEGDAIVLRGAPLAQVR